MGVKFCGTLQRVSQTSRHPNGYTRAALPRRRCGGAATAQGDDAGGSQKPTRTLDRRYRDELHPIGKVWLNSENEQLEEKRLPGGA